MRKAAVALGWICIAGICGFALAGAGSGPALGVVLGSLAIGAVATVSRVETGDLALFFVGLLALTITWNGIRLGASGSASGGVSGGAFGDLTMALAFAAVAGHVIIERRPVPLPPWLLLAGLGFFFAGLLSMVFPPSAAVMQHTISAQVTLASQQGAAQGVLIGVPSNLAELIKYELSLVLIPVLVAAVGVTPRRSRLLVDLWAAGAIINAAVAVLDIGGLHLGPTPAVGNRSAGLTIHPNYLALTCVLALPMPMLWLGRSRRWTIAGVLGLVALAGGVAASGSRAGSVAALVAVLATFFAVPRLRSYLPVALPLIGAAVIVVMAFTKTGQAILHQLRLGGSGSSTSGSNYQRSLVNGAAWAEVKARPLEGVGYGVLAGAHDIYLQLLDAGGVIAVVSFIVFIGGLAGALRVALRGSLRDEAIVCGIAILAWLLNGIFDNQLADKYLYLVPGLLLALSRTTWLLASEAAVASAGRELGPVREQLASQPSMVLEPTG
jgi:O-antigen ligase